MHVTVAHDRNLGLTMGSNQYVFVDNTFITEAFTEKFYGLNTPEGVPHPTRIFEQEAWENLDLNGVEHFWTAPFCAPFSNFNRTHAAPGEDDPMRHPKVIDAKTMVDLAIRYPLKSFMMESVARAYPFMREHFAPALTEAGYNVTLFQFDGYLMGMPQSRPRMFVVATRGTSFTEDYLTPFARGFNRNPENDRRRVWHHLKFVEDLSEIPETLKHEREIWSLTPRGHKLRSTFKLAIGDPHHAAPGLGLVKLHPMSVAPVISQSSDLFHPGEPRRLGHEEIMSLMTFPADLMIPGSFRNIYRLGNGVPYMVASVMAHALRDLFDNPPNDVGGQEISWNIQRSRILINDPWPPDLRGSRPDWEGKYYKPRGWKNDRSQRK